MGAYLERQTEQSVRNMRWGRFSTVGRSGCGAVAAYNVAVALGKNPDFKALVWAMERRRLPSCGGLLGMNVLRLQRWLQRRFGRAELCVLGTDRWEARTRFCRAAVIFYKNRGFSAATTSSRARARMRASFFTMRRCCRRRARSTCRRRSTA